ncbi:MAG: hypothetical protein ABSD89_13185 [Halobacteriota archaeon]|jgi:hypothetical protein
MVTTLVERTRPHRVADLQDRMVSMRLRMRAAQWRHSGSPWFQPGVRKIQCVRNAASVVGLSATTLQLCDDVADVSINTVTKLLVDLGAVCERFHNEHVNNVRVRRLQCDEIWSFVGAKAKRTEHEQVLGLMQEIIYRERVKQERAIDDLAVSVMEEAKGKA